MKLSDHEDIFKPGTKCEDCTKKSATHRVGGRKLCPYCASMAIAR